MMCSVSLCNCVACLYVCDVRPSRCTATHIDGEPCAIGKRPDYVQRFTSCPVARICECPPHARYECMQFVNGGNRRIVNVQQRIGKLVACIQCVNNGDHVFPQKMNGATMAPFVDVMWLRGFPCANRFRFRGRNGHRGNNNGRCYVKPFCTV